MKNAKKSGAGSVRMGVGGRRLGKWMLTKKSYFENAEKCLGRVGEFGRGGGGSGRRVDVKKNRV